jgi:hypothetical protein
MRPRILFQKISGVLDRIKLQSTTADGVDDGAGPHSHPSPFLPWTRAFDLRHTNQNGIALRQARREFTPSVMTH